jgi:hypothetical protein
VLLSYPLTCPFYLPMLRRTQTSHIGQIASRRRFSCQTPLPTPLRVNPLLSHVAKPHKALTRLWGLSPRRGKKTKSSVSLDDLPQGLVSREPLSLEVGVEAPAYPTVVLQAQSNMRKFENCVLLTRVGGFYELYFEHANEFGPLMNLKVAQKPTSAGPVSMVPPPTA